MIDHSNAKIIALTKKLLISIWADFWVFWDINYFLNRLSDVLDGKIEIFSLMSGLKFWALDDPAYIY
uniref:Uncharacterized protein n=1 Tax=Romanomermis culicivorax TaxID=13658 RepID=A0A915KJ91_ROMCU